MTGIFDQITGKDDTEASDGPDHDTSIDHDVKPDIHTTEEPDRTERALREASQELLRLGLLEQSHRPNLYRTALIHLERLNAILEPLDLLAKIDEIRGLAFLSVRPDADSNQEATTDQNDWSHPLVRKQRLTLEQTLLVAILRQHFIAYEQDAGAGATDAMVAVDELIPQFQVYLGNSGSESRDRERIAQLLNQLQNHGLVSAPDTHDRVVIRPMIAHLANPENLTALLHALKQKIAKTSGDSQEEDESGGEV
ncbi:MAG: DUF4194 domain-containing protein [Alcanivoracaceae bacterium]|nr:DUF4194 domain-containing protein [Alcanivoracaceae bacterium]